MESREEVKIYQEDPPSSLPENQELPGIPDGLYTGKIYVPGQGDAPQEWNVHIVHLTEADENVLTLIDPVTRTQFTIDQQVCKLTKPGSAAEHILALDTLLYFNENPTLSPVNVDPAK